MSDVVPNAAPRGKPWLAIGLAVFGVATIIIGFHVGDLAQQIRRAIELLGLPAGHQAQGINVADTVDSLLDVARSLNAVRRWLSFLGLAATLLPAAISETPKVVRVGSPAAGVICFLVMLFGRGLP